jgi:hypothetical protein
VEAADGYRVLHSRTPAGPFTVAVDFGVMTGVVFVADEVIDLRAEDVDYLWTELPTEPPEWFLYGELVEEPPPSPRFYQVVAYNAGGDGPPSIVVCGSPPGQDVCPDPPVG